MDTNLLIYAHREDSHFHAAAKAALDLLRYSPAHWAIPWPCVHEFIAVVTHSKIYQPPTALAAAFAAIDTWGAAGNLELVGESAGYIDKLRELSLKAKTAGGRIYDARIAALCLHHGVSELWTADRDFSFFPQLKIRNPLVKN